MHLHSSYFDTDPAHHTKLCFNTRNHTHTHTHTHTHADCENKDYEDPPRIFFEFVSSPTHPFDQAGSVVESVTVQQCDVYCYDNGTYSPVIFVASTVSIQATEPMYFRVRTIGGKGHNLQIPLYSTSGPEAADQGGLTDVVVTMGAMPMSTGTIIIIVFFAGIVIPYVLACPPLAMCSTMCCLDMLSNVLGECSGLSEVYL